MTKNVGGTVEFVGPATTNSAGSVAATATITTTTAGGATFGTVGSFSPGNVTGTYVGAIATVGLYDFASTDVAAGTAGTSPYTILGGSQVAGFYQSTGITTGTAAYDVPSSGGGNTLANSTAGTQLVRFNTPTALTLSFNATSCNAIQGILVTPKCGTFNETLGGSGGLQFVRSTAASVDYGVIWQNNTSGYLNFNSIIEPGRALNGGGGNTCGLIQAGPGTVVYGGVNDYDLNTYLNGGYSVVTADSGFGRPSLASGTIGVVYLNGGTVVGNANFTMDNAGANLRQFTIGVVGGGLAATAGHTMSVDGYISGTGALTIGCGTIAGSGAGTANTTRWWQRHGELERCRQWLFRRNHHHGRRHGRHQLRLGAGRRCVWRADVQ